MFKWVDDCARFVRQEGLRKSDRRGNRDPVPTYPPPSGSVPLRTRKFILDSEKRRIARIAHNTKLDPDQFQELMVPVIENFIGYVHLLPASQNHHHRGQGGLVAHSLEVSFLASQSASSKIFGFGETSKRKRREIPRWHVAAALVGLLHDVGKPISDMRILTEKKEVWNPFVSPIDHWGSTIGAGHYYVEWVKNRHRHHETIASTIIPEILTPEIKAWLSFDDVTILESVLNAISGSSEEKTLHPMMIRADEASVSRDMKTRAETGNGLGGEEQADSDVLPLKEQVLESMRDLIENGEWAVNEKGSRIWSGRQGVFIVWKRAAVELVNQLEKRQVTQFPRDAEALAQTLIDQGVLDPSVRSDDLSERVPYWLISNPSIKGRSKNNYVNAVKLSYPSQILEAPEDEMEIEIKGDPQSEFSRHEKMGIVTPGEGGKTSLEKDDPSNPMSSQESESNDKKSAEHIAESIDSELDKRKHQPASDQASIKIDGEGAVEYGLPDPTSLDVPALPDEDLAPEEIDEPSTPPTSPSEGGGESSVSDNPTSMPIEELSKRGVLGEAIRRLVSDIASGERDEDETIPLIKGHRYLIFPALLEPYGTPKKLAREGISSSIVAPRQGDEAEASGGRSRKSPAVDIGEGRLGLPLKDSVAEMITASIEQPSTEENRSSQNLVGDQIGYGMNGTPSAAYEGQPATRGGASVNMEGQDDQTSQSSKEAERQRKMAIAEDFREALRNKDERFYPSLPSVERRGNYIEFRRVGLIFAAQQIGYGSNDIHSALEEAPFFDLSSRKVRVRLE